MALGVSNHFLALLDVLVDHDLASYTRLLVDDRLFSGLTNLKGAFLEGIQVRFSGRAICRPALHVNLFLAQVD